VAFSVPGSVRALVFGGRLAAILLAFLTALATVSPARLVEAMTARGVRFGRIYLLASTLTVVPRLRDRARRIMDAQQCRGLRLGGSPIARLRALGPLVVPLVLSALAEVDEQALALDVRGASVGGVRTALETPEDHPADRAVRWVVLAVVIAAYTARFLGHAP
jgi:energy-coupling factor transporter transmembrane protein EcfT